MTFEEAQAKADMFGKGYKAELLSIYATCGTVVGGRYFPRRKVVQVLGLPTGRPPNQIARRWVATEPCEESFPPKA